MFRWADPNPKDAPNKPLTPPVDPRLRMLKWFSTAHLPDHLIGVVSQFKIIASWMISTIPDGPEATEAMRKLIEAKDCAVRAVIEGINEKRPGGFSAGQSSTTTREETNTASKEGRPGAQSESGS